MRSALGECELKQKDVPHATSCPDGNTRWTIPRRPPTNPFHGSLWTCSVLYLRQIYSCKISLNNIPLTNHHKANIISQPRWQAREARSTLGCNRCRRAFIPEQPRSIFVGAKCAAIRPIVLGLPSPLSFVHL